MLPDTTRITWLASYPKSGNTWTRALLTHYLRDSFDATHINDLYGGPIASSRLLFDRAIGIESRWLLPDEIDSLRPAVYRQAAHSGDGPAFIKVHDAWRITAGGEPLFPSDATHCVVYIVRNPLDVALSAAHHFGHSVAQAVDDLCDDSLTLSRFERHKAAPQLPQRLGSWSSHVNSWLREAPLRVHLMRYEDMIQDPCRAFGDMLRFIGFEVDDARLSEAVAASSFQKLRQQEATNGFRERLRQSTVPFFRKGIAGEWREALEPALARRLIDFHATTMHELGYLSDRHERRL